MLKQKMKVLAVSTAIISASFLSACSGQKAESVDLRKVLNSFSTSLDDFKPKKEVQKNAQADDAVMQEFTTFAQTNLNNPSFTDKKLGLELQNDGTFEGFTDANANSMRDSGEKTSFTVEVDTENKLLIATDMAGNSSSANHMMGGLLAGMLLGNLLSRQKRSGKKPSSASNKKAARSKSFSGSHSSGK